MKNNVEVDRNALTAQETREIKARIKRWSELKPLTFARAVFDVTEVIAFYADRKRRQAEPETPVQPTKTKGARRLW